MAYIKIRGEDKPMQVLNTVETIDKTLNTYPGTPWITLTEVVVADHNDLSKSITRLTRVFVRHIAQYYPSVKEMNDGQE